MVTYHFCEVYRNVSLIKHVGPEHFDARDTKRVTLARVAAFSAVRFIVLAIL